MHHGSRIRDVKCALDGLRIAAACDDGIAIWDLGESDAQARSLKSSGSTSSISWSPDGSQIASAPSYQTQLDSKLDNIADNEEASGEDAPASMDGAFARACGLLESARSGSLDDIKSFRDAAQAFSVVLNMLEEAHATTSDSDIQTLVAVCNNQMGYCLSKIGDEFAALDKYKQAVQRGDSHPDAPIWMTNYAMKLRMTGQVDEARTCLEAALSARPDYETA